MSDDDKKELEKLVGNAEKLCRFMKKQDWDVRETMQYFGFAMVINLVGHSIEKKKKVQDAERLIKLYIDEVDTYAKVALATFTERFEASEKKDLPVEQLIENILTTHLHKAYHEMHAQGLDSDVILKTGRVSMLANVISSYRNHRSKKLTSESLKVFADELSQVMTHMVNRFGDDDLNEEVQVSESMPTPNLFDRDESIN